MIRILANDGIEADGKLLLEDAGFEVVTDKVPQDQLPIALQEFDGILVRSATKVRQSLIDACPRLKLIGRGGVGLDNIDVEYARQKGIKVISTPAASSRSVAELVFAHIFSIARSLHISNREMADAHQAEVFKKLKSKYAQGVELRGKTMGILGYGRIGQEVGLIAHGLGMTILPVDVQPHKDFELRLINQADLRISQRVTTVPLNEMLAQADFISLHVPYDGHPVFGADEFSKMKPGATLINAARGGVVDELALIEALKSGRLRGAGLDTFENEPTPRAELLNHPLVSVTPHTGASTLEAQAQIGRELADRIIEFFGS
jgi:D-3-phosphoglycerate dehydrogenase